jgi:hypothetical protein
MKEKIDLQFSEILELKSQLSSMFIPTHSSQPTKRIDEKPPKSKPTALLIGTSNIAGINAEKLSNHVDTTKIIAYTIDQTQEVIKETSVKPDVIILHSLTNEVKNNEASNTVNKLQNVIQTIHTKWTDVKTIVSLTTPHADSRLARLNSEIVDGLLKRDCMDKKDIYISDNSNMWHGPTPVNDLLKTDKFHLSDRGVSLLASNIKNAMHKVLDIKSKSKSFSKFRNSNGYYKPQGGYYKSQSGYYKPQGGYYNAQWSA